MLIVERSGLFQLGVHSFGGFIEEEQSVTEMAVRSTLVTPRGLIFFNQDKAHVCLTITIIYETI